MIVAERRTRSILEQIKKLGNCSNKAAYEFEPHEVNRIFAAIRKELRMARAAFNPKPRLTDVEFHLGKAPTP